MPLCMAGTGIFLLTRLLRGVTKDTAGKGKYRSHISTHTPLARRDAGKKGQSQISQKFLLTRLLRGVTSCYTDFRNYYNISTHTPLARRDVPENPSDFGLAISTHTPLARRDE